MRSKQIKHSNDHIKGNQVRKGGEHPGTPFGGNTGQWHQNEDGEASIAEELTHTYVHSTYTALGLVPRPPLYLLARR